jgi:hypothetical protein
MALRPVSGRSDRNKAVIELVASPGMAKYLSVTLVSHETYNFSVAKSYVNLSAKNQLFYC